MRIWLEREGRYWRKEEETHWREGEGKVWQEGDYEEIGGRKERKGRVWREKEEFGGSEKKEIGERRLGRALRERK